MKGKQEVISAPVAVRLFDTACASVQRRIIIKAKPALPCPWHINLKICSEKCL